MEVKIGKGHLSQIKKPFESSDNKIPPDGLVKFLKEMDEQYNHRVNTRREYCARLVCKDGKVRDVQVVESKKGSDECGSEFYYYKETDNGIITASYHDIINLFLKHKTKQLMTFEEAKKILKKEGFHMVLANRVIYQNGAIREFAKPEVCEAIKVANANRWTVGLSPIEWYEREARLKKVIAEKDEVIADLGNELAATKKELEEKTKLVEEVRKYSKEYREYGIEAVKMIRKMAKAIVCGKPICSEDFKEYRRLANGCSFNPQLPDLSEEEDKKLSPVKDDNSNGDVTNRKDISPSLKVTVRLFGDDVIDLFKNMQHLW